MYLRYLSLSSHVASIVIVIVEYQEVMHGGGDQNGKVCDPSSLRFIS